MERIIDDPPPRAITAPSAPTSLRNGLPCDSPKRRGENGYCGTDLADPHHRYISNFSSSNVPYRGGIPAVTGLLGNQTNMLFLGVVGVAPMVKAGKRRAIAATGKQRSSMFPNVPTLAKSGFPDWNTGTWYGVLVPAKTPPAVIAILNKQINDALNQPDVRKQLAAVGLEPVGTTADQFSSLIKAGTARWQKVVEKNPELLIED